MYIVLCDKCNGSGKVSYNIDNGTCWNCNGTGKHRTNNHKEYTSQLEYINKNIETVQMKLNQYTLELKFIKELKQYTVIKMQQEGNIEIQKNAFGLSLLAENEKNVMQDINYYTNKLNEHIRQLAILEDN